MNRKSILIVDDSSTARQGIREALEKTPLFSTVHEASGVLEAFKTVLSHPVDIVICDLEMPELDGFKFLKMMNSREDFMDIPVIMLTGREDLQTKIRGLEEGASDYVTKPFDPGELIARIKVQLKIKDLQDHLKESNAQLRALSNTDSLTGLRNRRCLMITLEKELRRSDRTGSPLALVMADIDYFKKINDTYGHQQGDVILKKVADLMARYLRQYDLAARFGGEEFALVLAETSIVQAIQVAERIRTAATQLVLDECPDALSLTISFGVASYPSPEITTVDDLIRAADAALYRAKDLGRNRVAINSA